MCFGRQHDRPSLIPGAEFPFRHTSYWHGAAFLSTVITSSFISTVRRTVLCYESLQICHRLSLELVTFGHSRFISPLILLCKVKFYNTDWMTQRQLSSLLVWDVLNNCAIGTGLDVTLWRQLAGVISCLFLRFCIHWLFSQLEQVVITSSIRFLYFPLHWSGTGIA